ncbi:TIGR04282 family arsenosugar biosynthesis glycosyltransferase [Thermodesulfobacteriota bacterium]
MPDQTDPHASQWNDKHKCALVFVKAPIKEGVKTRLSKNMPAGLVLDLYKNFVKDILENLEAGGHHIIIYFYPKQEASRVREWLGDKYTFKPQTGKNLGERMANAFSSEFSEGYQQALLIGTDFPDLPGSIINEAFEGLSTHAAVIGPAVDGGYYLIGFRAGTFYPHIFKNIPWGTARVYCNTIQILKNTGYKIHVLPEWRDIDDYRDLENFIQTNRKEKSAATHTLRYLKKIGLL